VTNVFSECAVVGLSTVYGQRLALSALEVPFHVVTFPGKKLKVKYKL
jgi:hypothetical protein